MTQIVLITLYIPIDVQLVFGANATLYGCLVWLSFREAIVFLVEHTLLLSITYLMIICLTLILPGSCLLLIQWPTFVYAMQCNHVLSV